MKKLILLAAAIFLAACAGNGVKKVVVDESPNKSSWVDDERISWEDGDKLFFKSKQTVRGDQRLNGCYTLASHDNREVMIRQIAETMKGATDEAQSDISENAELILGKVRSGEWAGKLYGFKDEGQFFERYQIRDLESRNVTERIDCYTLSSMSKSDYTRTKNEIVNKIQAIDPKIKSAIVNKQVQFFEPESRSPASAGEGE